MPRIDPGEQRIDVSRVQPSTTTTVLGSNGVAHQLGHLDSPSAKFSGDCLVLCAPPDVQDLGSTPRSHVADDKDVTSLRQADPRIGSAGAYAPRLNLVTLAREGEQRIDIHGARE